MPSDESRCRQTELAVVSLLLGELEPDELVSAGQHIGQCTSCRIMVLELSSTSLLLRRYSNRGALRRRGLSEAVVREARASSIAAV